MKILRVRRGFTTNSSASSEWIPAQPGKVGIEGAPSATTPLNALTSSTPSSTQPSANSGADAAKMGGLIALVAIAFTVQKVVRSLLHRKKETESSDD